MKKIFAILLLCLLFASMLCGSVALAADNAPSGGFYILKDVSGDCLGSGNCTPCDAVQVLVTLSDMIVSFSGAAALLAFIVGGIIMITAYGSDRINMGKNTIVAALVGLVIVFAAWILVNTIILMLFGTMTGVFGSMTGEVASTGFGYSCAGK